MVAKVKDVLGKFKSTRAAGGGNFFKDGKGVACVKMFKHDNTYDGQQLTTEFKIISSEKIDVRDDAGNVLDVEPNKPGSSVTWLAQYEQFESAHAAAKALTYALAGAEEMGDDEFEETYKNMADFHVFEGQGPVYDANGVNTGTVRPYSEKDRQNPARGMLIGFETYRRNIRSGPNAGKPIVLVKWASIGEAGGNSDADIEARRAALDAGTL